MPDANAISIPFPVYGLHHRQSHEGTGSASINNKVGRHQGKWHESTIALQTGSTVITTTITYYYRTSVGIHGSTTNFNSIPANSVIEARITT
jgi:hypothetical protein